MSAARFDGTWRVHFAVTKTPGGGAALKKGDTWSDTWTITPNCASGACGAEIDGGLGPPGFTYHSFILELTRSGATYTGSVKEKITTCGGNPPVGVMVKNTVSVEINVTKGAFRGDAWVATAWSGTLVLASPYKRNGIWYCPAQQWKMSLESSPA